MFEFKEETPGYKANNVSTKPLDFSKGGWQPGNLKNEFFAPHEGIPGIKVSATSTADLKSDKPAGTKPQADDSSVLKATAAPAQEEPKAAKPELKVPEPPSAAIPIVIPAAFAPVMTAGALSGMQRDQARGKSSSKDVNGPEAASAGEFNLGDDRAAVRRARGDLKLRDQLIARDADQNNGSRDLLELVAQEQQNQFQRQMNNLINEELDRLREEKARREQRIAELERQRVEEGQTRSRILTALDGNRTRMRLTEENLQRLHAEGKITEERLKELQEKLRLKNKEIEDNKAKIQSAGQAVDKTKEDARKAESDSAQAGQEKKALTQAKDIYQQNIDMQNEKIKLLEQEIRQNEAKLLKDANGNAVYKDEKGNLYTKAADGSKNTLSDSEQQALKEKMAAEGLVTQDTIDEKNKQLATEQENLKGYEEGKRLAQELKQQAEQKQAEAERDRIILEAVSTDAESELAAHKLEQKKLIDEQSDLEKKIKQTRDKLDEINKDILAGEKDKETLLAQQKQLEKDLKASEARDAEITRLQKEEAKRINQIDKDMNALTKLRERMNDPEMKKRLDSNDKNVREAAYKELYDSAPPRLQARIMKEYNEYEEKRKATAQASPTQPQAAAQQPTQPVQTQQAQTPQTAVAASADNTSRPNGSASGEAITVATRAGPPFADAAAGVAPVEPVPAEMTPDQILTADHTQRSAARSNLGAPSA